MDTKTVVAIITTIGTIGVAIVQGASRQSGGASSGLHDVCVAAATHAESGQERAHYGDLAAKADRDERRHRTARMLGMAAVGMALGYLALRRPEALMATAESL